MLSLSSSLWSSRCLMVGPTATLQSSRFALIAGSLAARSPQELGDLRQIEQNHWERPTKNHCCCRWHKSLTVTNDKNYRQLPMTKGQRTESLELGYKSQNMSSSNGQWAAPTGWGPPLLRWDYQGSRFRKRMLSTMDVCIYLRSIWMILLIWRLLWSWFLQVWHLNCPNVGTRIKYKLKMSWKDQLKV